MANKKIKLSTPVASDDWETRNDFETLCRARTIESDKKRMSKVREFAKKQMMDAAGIASDDAEGEDD